MAKSDANAEITDDLDAFFNAAGSENSRDLMNAAQKLDAHGGSESPPPDAEDDPPEAVPPSPPRPFSLPPEHLAKVTGRVDLEGKYIAVEAGEGDDPDRHFVLIPAHVYSYVPWWGWTAIGVSLAMLAVGVIFMPLWSLNRLAARLGDGNAASAQLAMRELVMNGDERTVRKLHDMASSNRESLTARLRAVDTMSLIGGVPEVDRALLRLELSGGTNEQVREAAIAARKQREAARTRSR